MSDSKDTPKISQALYLELCKCARLAFGDQIEKSNQVFYLAIADWAGEFNLPLLIEKELVSRLWMLTDKTDGIHRYFPAQAYELTTNAKMILEQPGIYIQSNL